MKRNMSDIDRIVRVIVAALFAWLYFSGIVTGGPGIVLLVLADVFILTWCDEGKLENIKVVGKISIPKKSYLEFIISNYRLHKISS